MLCLSWIPQSKFQWVQSCGFALTYRWSRGLGTFENKAPHWLVIEEAIHTILCKSRGGQALMNHSVVLLLSSDNIAPHHCATPSRHNLHVELPEKCLAATTGRNIVQVNEHSYWTEATIVVFFEELAWSIPHHVQWFQELDVHVC
eukprot:Skav226512  [mRNA]  locus=scaffold1773:69421:76144:+ [translate_table: standard]